MFRVLSIISFLAVLAAIIMHHTISARISQRPRWHPVNILKKLVYLLTLLLLERRLTTLSKLRKLLYLLTLLCFMILAVTGFYPALVGDRELSGYLLMIHVTFGGVFAVCMAALALMWADRCVFDGGDLAWLQSVWRRKKDVRESLIVGVPFWQKALFWIIITLTLPVILSIVLSMFEIFGTWGQILLAEVHRYCALAFALLAIMHTYFLVCARSSK